MSIFWAYIKFRIAVAVLRLAGRVLLLALAGVSNDHSEASLVAGFPRLRW